MPINFQIPTEKEEKLLENWKGEHVKGLQQLIIRSSQKY